MESYNELFNEIKESDALEEEIEASAIALASKLLLSGRTDVTVLGRRYTVSYRKSRHQQDVMELVAIDHIRLSLIGTKYNPAVFTANISHDFSELENVAVLTEAFYRYKHGAYKVEDLED